MIHEILPVGVLQCNCSVFGDEATREGLVVDPGDNIEEILEVIRRHNLTIKAIVITHAHIDHIGGAQKLKRAIGAPIYMNSNDRALQLMMAEQASWLRTTGLVSRFARSTRRVAMSGLTFRASPRRRTVQARTSSLA